MEGARSHSRVGRKTHAGSGGDGACMVHVKHDAVPGRVRLAVPRLYRSRKIKALLEHGLSRDAAICRLAADIRTGTLLVEFDPALEHAEIASRVEHLLTGKNSPLAARSADEDMSPASGEADWHIRDLEEIVALLSKLGTGTVVLEWVDPSDPLFRTLARGRDFDDLTRDRFEKACTNVFEIAERQSLTGGTRHLYRLRKKT